jgi:uncharacterized caspase-like protein
MILAARIVATVLAVLLCAGEAFAEKRVALVIGNAGYAHAPPLDNPIRDATAVSVMLEGAGFKVATHSNLDYAGMGQAISDFSEEARDADVAVVFYAGHGIEVEGTNYLIPTDARLARDIDVWHESIALDLVLRVLEPARSLRLVILDACRDNPFARGMKRTLASRSVGRGLASVEPQDSNTLIAFAAKAGSIAHDGDGGAHSPFTSALLKYLTAPGLDLRFAFGKVRDEVFASTGKRQEPHTYGSLGGTAIALVPVETSLGAAAGAAPSPAAIGSLSSETSREYESALRLGTVEALDAFLAAHPSGTYADIARVHRAKLLAAVPPTAPTPATAPSPAAAPTPAVAPPPQAEPEKRSKARATRDTDPPAARAKPKPAKEAAPSTANRSRSSSSGGCGYVRRAVSAGTAAGLDNGVGLIAYARRNCGG